MAVLSLFKAIWDNDEFGAIQAIYGEGQVDINSPLTEQERAELKEYITQQNEFLIQNGVMSVDQLLGKGPVSGLLEAGQTPLLATLCLERMEIALILLNSDFLKPEDMEICNNFKVSPIVMASMIGNNYSYSKDLESLENQLSEEELINKINQSKEIFDKIHDLNPSMLVKTNIQMHEADSESALQYSPQLYHLSSHAFSETLKYVVSKHKDALGLLNDMPMGGEIAMAALDNMEKLSFVLDLYPGWLIKNAPNESSPIIYAVERINGKGAEDGKKLELVFRKLNELDKNLINSYHKTGSMDTLLSSAGRAANKFAFDIMLEKGANPNAIIGLKGRSTKDAIEARSRHSSGEEAEIYKSMLDKLENYTPNNRLQEDISAGAEEVADLEPSINSIDMEEINHANEILNELLDYNPECGMLFMEYSANKTESNKNALKGSLNSEFSTTGAKVVQNALDWLEGDIVDSSGIAVSHLGEESDSETF
ncbi:MAG: hypothetical protein P8P83_00500 [Rickettsiaceae bacterium]|nr:hypothetical protein [Rickettsiaceae bacterium]